MSKGGIGFGGALAVLFIGLKLTHYISWSWWWVLSPLWGGLALVLGVTLLAGGGALVFVFVAFLFVAIMDVFSKKPKPRPTIVQARPLKTAATYPKW